MLTHYCKQDSKYFDVIEYNFNEWVQKVNPPAKINASNQPYYACDFCKDKIQSDNSNSSLVRMFVIRGFSFCKPCWESHYKQYKIK